MSGISSLPANSMITAVHDRCSTFNPPFQGRIQDFSMGGAKLPVIIIWVVICNTVDLEIFAVV